MFEIMQIATMIASIPVEVMQLGVIIASIPAVIIAVVPWH